MKYGHVELAFMNHGVHLFFPFGQNERTVRYRHGMHGSIVPGPGCASTS